MKFEVVSRKKAKLRIGLSAASGYGKTYSALLMAFGMTGDWNKIGLIDTENNSAQLYENLGKFHVYQLKSPYSPERYNEAIKTGEDAGFEVLIIDSITHEWDGEGGCLEICDKITQQSTTKNSYTSWAKVTPRHNSFIQTILKSPCHIITTVRRKQDYDMIKNDRGKLEVVKVGTKEITRDGFEYELTCNLEILNENHYCKASKDRTQLFANKEEFVIDIETGKKLIEWANFGVDEVVYFIESLNNCQSRTDGINLVRANPQFNKSATQFNKVYSNNELLEKAFEDFKIKFPAPPKVEVENTNIEK